ncbi:MAG: hypothetical protein KAJ73_10265 [Zetaproteobacteria bacterium]|nr:hypothetical protein [Zetaproteobacteria bacterium]
MSIVIGDVLRIVAVLAWLDGDILQNVFNAQVVGTGGPYDDSDIVDDMRLWCTDMYTHFLGQMSDEIDGAEVRVYKYDSGDADWDEVGIDQWGFNPTNTGEQLPRGVSLLINLKTVDPDVSGKKYLGAMGEAQVTDGLFTAAEITRAAAFGAEWLTPFTGSASSADIDPGVWSVKNGQFFVAANTLIIPSIPAYQRRRKQGVGI